VPAPIVRVVALRLRKVVVVCWFGHLGTEREKEREGGRKEEEMEVCMWVYVWRQCVECVRDMCVYACEGLPNGTHRILRDSLCGMYSMVRESARERELVQQNS
jgi:hypothetical protein